jgi:hypothetical protein
MIFLSVHTMYFAYFLSPLFSLLPPAGPVILRLLLISFFVDLNSTYERKLAIFVFLSLVYFT